MSRLLLMTALFVASTSAFAGPPVAQPADPLPPGAVARFGSARLLHGPGADSLKFLADGKTLASCDENDVRLWDLNTGRLQHNSSLPYAVSSRLLLPDGTVVAAFVEGPRPPMMMPRAGLGGALGGGALGGGALGGGTLGGALGGALGGEVIDSKARFQAFDSRSGKVRLTLPGRVESPAGLASSLGGRFMAVDRGAEGVFVHELPGGKKIARLQPPDMQRFGKMVFSADGKLLAGLHHEISSVWDVEGQRQLARRELPGDSASPIAGAFSPDGRTLAVSWSKSVRLYDARTFNERKDFRPASANCLELAFATDGKQLIGITDTHEIVRWSMIGGRIAPPIKLNEDVRAWAFSNDAGLLAFVRDSGQIHLLDLQTGRERDIPQRRAPLWDTVCLPSGNVASATANGEICFWDLKDGHEISRHQVAGYRPYQPLQLSPNGKHVLRFRFDGTTTVHDVGTDKKLFELAHQGQVQFSPDGRLLVIFTEKGGWQLWNVAAGKVVRTIGKADADAAVEFAPDGRTITVAAAGGATVYEVATGQPRGPSFLRPSVEEPPKTLKVLYARDGKTLILVREHDLSVFSTADSKLVWHFPLDRKSYVFGVSADGRWLAAADIDSTPPAIFVQDLWSKTPAKIVQELRGHAAMLMSLSYTPDGKYLVSGSHDGTSLVWDVARFTAAVSKPLVPDEALLAKWWNLLAARKPEKAGEPMQGFGGSPALAVSFFKARLQPAEGPMPGRIAALIRDLDAPKLATRQQAIHDLKKLGELAEAELEAVLKNKPALEVANHVKKLLEKLDGPVTDPDRLRELRAIEVLERIGTVEAKKLLETLAGGAPEARLTQEAKATLRRLNPRTP